MSFVGGKLKLKGGVDIVGKSCTKKKKKKTAAQQHLDRTEAGTSQRSTGGEDAAQGSAGAVGPLNPPVEDRRTEAEKKHDAYMMKFEEQRAKKAASKSHRERIKDLNEKLATLTEHHDIPRISYVA